MKKTININLAGIHFHIDEDAFLKLADYLDAIRSSLKNTEGSDEIIQDIEARIAELFSEKIDSINQVVSMRELDEVIEVMGQPEDYEVDGDSFEGEPEPTSTTGRTSYKKLFRDIDNKYIGGVSSGLGHYVGIDGIWIRLIWILLILAGMGSPILIYILLWILVPAAITTADKLRMTGEPVNISNIEKKFKEGYNNVADRVKNVDYDKYGNKIKKGSSQFFDAAGSVLKVLLMAFAKITGVILVIIAFASLIGVIYSSITFGNFAFWGGQIGYSELFNLIDIPYVPLWLLSLLLLFALGIPFVALFILGLKLLIDNLKPMSTTIKILLLAVWLLSIIGLLVIGNLQSRERAYSSNFVENIPWNISPADTIQLSMLAVDPYGNAAQKRNGVSLKFGQNDQQFLYSQDIEIELKSTQDSIGTLIIDKKSKGNSFINAKKRAENVEYNYTMDDHQIRLNGYFTTQSTNKYREQKIKITVFLPQTSVFQIDENLKSFLVHNSQFRNTIDQGSYYQLSGKELLCLDCLEKEDAEEQIDSTEIEPEQIDDWENHVLDKFEE